MADSCQLLFHVRPMHARPASCGDRMGTSTFSRYPPGSFGLRCNLDFMIRTIEELEESIEAVQRQLARATQFPGSSRSSPPPSVSLKNRVRWFRDETRRGAGPSVDWKSRASAWRYRKVSAALRRPSASPASPPSSLS